MKKEIFSSFINFLMIIHYSTANFGSYDSGQYHIQTDEGDERFFKYQTNNGQFRKEKRLQDGTVIGTNAWIDGFGYLRQDDYIADQAGYRILNAKTVFVGKDRPIQEAMKIGKKVQSKTGISVTTPHTPTHSDAQIPLVTKVSPISFDKNYLIPDHHYNHNPSVLIRPHAYPIERYTTESNSYKDDHQYFASRASDSISIEAPSIHFEPPFDNSLNDSKHSLSFENNHSILSDESHLPPIAYYPSSTTVKPLIKDESHLPPIAFYPSSTENPLDYDQVVNEPLKNDLLTLKDNNADSYDTVIPITSRPRVFSSRYESVKPQTFVNNDRFSIDTAESYSVPKYKYYKQNYQSLFDKSKYHKSPSYNSIGEVSNGFRYILPRQYHAEVENFEHGSRDGSFGYIDPFGIRRVVYYNAGKNGFIHRKNNRYVGFNSTPYDPAIR